MRIPIAAVIAAVAACSDGADGSDAWPPDGAPGDAQPADAPGGAPDAAFDAAADARTDAAVADAYVPPDLDYQHLSETGLYTDIATKELSPEVIEVSPAYPLWSDGAAKRRWLWLPPGTQIDTTDMDSWQFPVGTRVWKEFRHDTGDGTTRLETRLIERRGPNPGDVWMASFAWNESESDAEVRPFGDSDVRGTDHDIPAADQCARCHRGEASRVLGVSALQLSHDGPGSLGELASMGLLSAPPPPGVTYPPPGNSIEAAALGYLHANCGGCHRSSAGQSCHDLTGLSLRVHAGDDSAEQTDAYLTAAGQPLTFWTEEGFTHRVVPGDPEASALLYRMIVREEGAQMPPAFTEVADDAGVAAVQAWIEALPD